MSTSGATGASPRRSTSATLSRSRRSTSATPPLSTCRSREPVLSRSRSGGAQPQRRASRSGGARARRASSGRMTSFGFADDLQAVDPQQSPWVAALPALGGLEPYEEGGYEASQLHQQLGEHGFTPAACLRPPSLKRKRLITTARPGEQLPEQKRLVLLLGWGMQKVDLNSFGEKGHKSGYSKASYQESSRVRCLNLLGHAPNSMKMSSVCFGDDGALNDAVFTNNGGAIKAMFFRNYVERVSNGCVVFQAPAGSRLHELHSLLYASGRCPSLPAPSPHANWDGSLSLAEWEALAVDPAAGAPLRLDHQQPQLPPLGQPALPQQHALDGPSQQQSHDHRRVPPPSPVTQHASARPSGRASPFSPTLPPQQATPPVAATIATAGAARAGCYVSGFSPQPPPQLCAAPAAFLHHVAIVGDDVACCGGSRAIPSPQRRRRHGGSSGPSPPGLGDGRCSYHPGALCTLPFEGHLHRPPLPLGARRDSLASPPSVAPFRSQAVVTFWPSGSKTMFKLETLSGKQLVKLTLKRTKGDLQSAVINLQGRLVPGDSGPIDKKGVKRVDSGRGATALTFALVPAAETAAVPPPASLDAEIVESGGDGGSNVARVRLSIVGANTAITATSKGDGVELVVDRAVPESLVHDVSSGWLRGKQSYLITLGGHVLAGDDAPPSDGTEVAFDCVHDDDGGAELSFKLRKQLVAELATEDSAVEGSEDLWG